MLLIVSIVFSPDRLAGDTPPFDESLIQIAKQRHGQAPRRQSLWVPHAVSSIALKELTNYGAVDEALRG